MKVLLVSVHPYPSPQSIPLATAFLKAAVAADPRLAGVVSCDLVEYMAGDDPTRCAEDLLARAPDAVAFSVYVWNRDFCLAVAEFLAKSRPGLLLIAGGPEPTANPLPLIEGGAFAALIRGEGELSFPAALARVLDRLPLKGVPGVVVAGGDVETFSLAPAAEAIPSPYLDGTLDPGASTGALWQISRGCDFACSFCYDHRREAVRRLPMERLEKELLLLAAAGVSQVFVLDSTFNKIPARAKAILRMIARLAPEVHFHFEVRYEFIDPEMAELFASITCSLQIGLQSSDLEVLAGVGRPFDAERFAARIDLLNQTGAVFGFDLIYGLPGDSLARFRASLDYALSLYPNHLDVFPLAVLPGTKLSGQAAELELRHLLVPPYTVVATPTFPAEALAQAQGLALACDVFYSRGKAVAWFNAVARALKLTPSSLLAGFAGWLGGRGQGGEEQIEEGEIHGMQRAFLESAFVGKRRRLLPLALDLVDYHHLYARALLSPPTAPLSRRKLQGLDLLRVPLALSASAAPASFHYDIAELLDAGEPDLAGFASQHAACGSCAVVYPSRGEVRTELLDPLFLQLLTALDGATPAGKICGRLGIAPEDGREFLGFAAGEGIVVPAA